MAFGATGNTGYAEKFGAITAEESRAIGVHWNLFPVADVNSNPENPIINTRSFGEDPAQVGNLVAAFIKGSKEHGMLTAAKHFPGHGDTGTDSHLGVAKVGGDMAHIQTIELPPFKKAIEAGVDSILTAHVAVPALEPDPNKVATISENVISNLLEKQLGFKGVVITGVDGGSVAADKRLTPGSTIVAIEQEQMTGAADVQKKVDALKKAGKKTALLLVATAEGDMLFVALPIE